MILKKIFKKDEMDYSRITKFLLRGKDIKNTLKHADLSNAGLEPVYLHIENRPIEASDYKCLWENIGK